MTLTDFKTNNMERERIKLTKEELKDIVYGDSESYEVIKQTTTGHWRHGSEEQTIIKRVEDQKFFKINWRDSVKDECEFGDMNYDGEYEEVFPEVVTIIEYK